MASVKLYNTSREKVAHLPLAFDLGYEKKMTTLWRAWFSIPMDDPHIDDCQNRYFAEIFDNCERVELFQIVKRWKTHNDKGPMMRFECYHVLATLLMDEFDDTFYGSAGTATALGEVLGEQLTANWTLGTCDFNTQYLFSWPRGTKLLKALIDIPDRMQQDYLWTFDTESYPWTVNLVEPSSTVTAYIDEGRNMKEVELEEDSTGDNYATRLYPHGAGAGADQIGIASVNPTGKAYLDAAGATEVVVHHWTDQNYTTAQELYDAAVQYLARISTPRTFYRTKAADIAKLTGLSTDQFTLGALVSLENSTLDIDVDQRIVAITKGDVLGSPGDVELEIANKSELFDLRTYIQTNDLSNVTIENIPGGAVGALPATPTFAGLYISTDYLGYHDGTNWATYMDSYGRLYAQHDNAHFRFNPVGGTLDIKVTTINLSGTVNIIDTAQIVNGAVTDAKVTSMSVDKLTTGTLDAQTITLANAGAIRLGKESYNDTDAGFWLGEGGVNALFNIGDASNYLKWNGEDLLMSGTIVGFSMEDTLDMNNNDISNVATITATTLAGSLSTTAISATGDLTIQSTGNILIDGTATGKKIGFDLFAAAYPLWIEVWSPTGGSGDGWIRLNMGENGGTDRYITLHETAT